MSEEDRSLLNDLKVNTQQFFEQFGKLESEKKVLEEKVLAFNQDIKKLEQEKVELIQKNEYLKIAAHILSGVDENREAKMKINTLVREIDKCIALLNK